MNPVYESLKQAVEAAGFFTTPAPCDDGTHRIVCASAKLPGNQGLSGNSFWIAERDGRWFAGAWGGHVYHFSGDKRIAEFCIEWMQKVPRGLPADFDDAIKAKFSLVKVTDESEEN